MQTGLGHSLSPSLSRYSSEKLQEIAARVVQEFRDESDCSSCGGVLEFTYEGESSYPRNEQQDNHADEVTRNEGEDDDDDFEFVVAGRDATSSPVSADEIFYNGKIRPTYPVFNRNLYFDGFGFVHDGSNCEKPAIPPPIRLPLGKLMREDRDPPSCSSSEADELEGIPAEIYCVWKPKTEEQGGEEASPAKCKKSSSVGSSSKRWKFRDLLYRSNSEGKDSLLFLSPAHSRGKRNGEEPDRRETYK